MSSNSPWSVQAIIDRIEREKRQAAGTEPPPDHATTADYSVRGLWSCYSDPGKLTAAQAHIAMQLHLECGVRTCTVRSRARTALVAAGRMILDPRASHARRTPRSSVFTLLRAAVFGYSTLLFGGRHALR
ncbi:hypothetical protein [Nocardia tengchongensis]|uniref:hypothetical protein n=1 Tax=Nocardia tengchongensis TaxID=2055889 RepID=UPI0036B27AF6